ncbi:MAG: hypothetical protein WD022_12285 [Balneolaceae bacterium]
MKNTLEFNITFKSPDDEENGEDTTNPDDGGKVGGEPSKAQ